ncbi:MAG TPA: glycerol-3-phosphate acyltransferase, partial [bacterium]|nr:glycerol-3-phosphate acyltransferase [bacterium]
RALTVEEMRVELSALLAEIRARGIPTTELALDGNEDVTRVLEGLVANGVLAVFDGPERVFGIAPDAHLVASYYRNTVIHYFVLSSIVELALLRAAQAKGDAKAAFFDEAMRLRDLLKFEFFFAEKEAFREEIVREVAAIDAGWETAMSRSPDAVRGILRKKTSLHAHRTLRAFLESQLIVADALVRQPGKVEEGAFLEYCLALGRQRRLQQRIRSSEAVSKVLFQSALKLAGNQKLLEADAQRRQAFADEIRECVRSIDAVEALASARRAGLV